MDKIYINKVYNMINLGISTRKFSCMLLLFLVIVISLFLGNYYPFLISHHKASMPFKMEGMTAMATPSSNTMATTNNTMMTKPAMPTTNIMTMATPTASIFSDSVLSKSMTMV